MSPSFFAAIDFQVIQNLHGQLAGENVRHSLKMFLDQLPQTVPQEAQKSDVYEHVLTTGEYLAPYIFAEDKNIAHDARMAMKKLGSYITRDALWENESNILIMFRHLEVSKIFNFYVTSHPDHSDVIINIRDIFKAAGFPSENNSDGEIRLGIFQEYIGELGIQTLQEGIINEVENDTVKFSITGSEKCRAASLIAVALNGQEIFRQSNLTHDHHALFLI